MHIAFDDTVSEAPRYTKCGFAPEELKSFFEQSESLTQPDETSEASHEIRKTQVGRLSSDESLWRFESSSSMDSRAKKTSFSSRISVQTYSDVGSFAHGGEECSPSSISSQLQKSFAAFRRELSRDFQTWKRDLCVDFHRMMQGKYVPDEMCSLDKVLLSGIEGSSLSSIAEKKRQPVNPPQLPSLPSGSGYRVDSTRPAVRPTGRPSTGTRDAMPIISDFNACLSALRPTRSFPTRDVFQADRAPSTTPSSLYGSQKGLASSPTSQRLSSIVNRMSRITVHTHAPGTLFGDVDDILADQALKDSDPYDVKNLYHTSGLAQCVASSRIFNLSVLLMILFNTFYMAIEADYNHDERLVDSHWAFQLCEIVFSIFFVLEISIRFGAFARKRDSLGDSCFVVDSLLALHLLVDTYVLDFLAPKSGLSLRLFRFFGLLRLLRFARLLRASSAITTIMKAIYAGARAIASMWVMVIFLTYLFALALHSLLVDENSMREHFGDIPASMWTLVLQGIFMDGITDVFAKLRKIQAPVSIVFLLVFVLLSNFVMINVLLGILCKVVNKVALAEEESRARIHVVRATLALLQSLDIDSNCCINKCEFLELFQNPQAFAALEELRIDAEYLHGMTEMLFTSADTELPISVVVDLLLKHRIERPCRTGEMMRAMKLQRFWTAREYERFADEVTRSIREFAAV